MCTGTLWSKGGGEAPTLATVPSGTPPTAQQRHRGPDAHSAWDHVAR